MAREAAKSGLEAGMLRADDFDLGTNLWIVFAGRFDNQESAERQAGNLAERYPGAYATWSSRRASPVPVAADHPPPARPAARAGTKRGSPPRARHSIDAATEAASAPRS